MFRKFFKPKPPFYGRQLSLSSPGDMRLLTDGADTDGGIVVLRQTVTQSKMFAMSRGVRLSLELTGTGIVIAKAWRLCNDGGLHIAIDHQGQWAPPFITHRHEVTLIPQKGNILYRTQAVSQEYGIGWGILVNLDRVRPNAERMIDFVCETVRICPDCEEGGNGDGGMLSWYGDSGDEEIYYATLDGDDFLTIDRAIGNAFIISRVKAGSASDRVRMSCTQLSAPFTPEECIAALPRLRVG